MATITPQNCSAGACNGGGCVGFDCDNCDGYSPYSDGDPCVDCGRPVWYADDHDTWYHAVEGECFLATYRKKPEAQAEPEEPEPCLWCEKAIEDWDKAIAWDDLVWCCQRCHDLDMEATEADCEEAHRRLSYPG